MPAPFPPLAGRIERAVRPLEPSAPRIGLMPAPSPPLGDRAQCVRSRLALPSLQLPGLFPPLEFLNLLIAVEGAPDRRALSVDEAKSPGKQVDQKSANPGSADRAAGQSHS